MFVMGIIEQPFTYRSIPFTTPQPTIEIALTYAYCQHIGHEIKNCPFVDDKCEATFVPLLPVL
jgi:hypothetical protein